MPRVSAVARRAIIALGVILGTMSTATPAAAQGALADHPRVAEAARLLDVWLESEMAYERIPGMSVAVVHDQEVIWTGAWGEASPGVPANSRTLYRACSIVKPFTATAVMQLRDRGLLDLSDPVQDHLAWFDVRNPYENASPITIESLLTHSSGLPRDLPFSYWTGPDYPFPTRDALIATLPQMTLAHAPRTRSNYSNVGMTLAGEVVAAASGEEFATYLHEHVFEPLGMRETYIDGGARRGNGRLATGYSVLQRDGSRGRIPDYSVRALMPAAGLVTNVEDLARFAFWQFRAVDAASDDVLAPLTLRDMHRIQWVQPDGWTRSAFGFQTWAENDRHFVGHAGACPGYESKLLLRVPEKIGVILMTNAQGPDVDGYAQRIHDVMAPAIRAAAEAAAADPSVNPHGRFAGIYRRDLGGEVAVVEWQGGVALLHLPTSNPRSIEVFEPVDDHTFQRRGTSGPNADVLRFDALRDGRIRMTRDYQFSFKVD